MLFWLVITVVVKTDFSLSQLSFVKIVVAVVFVVDATVYVIVTTIVVVHSTLRSSRIFSHDFCLHQRSEFDVVDPFYTYRA